VYQNSAQPAWNRARHVARRVDFFLVFFWLAVEWDALLAFLAVSQSVPKGCGLGGPSPCYTTYLRRRLPPYALMKSTMLCCEFVADTPPVPGPPSLVHVLTV